jgi:hypothetical protein
VVPTALECEPLSAVGTTVDYRGRERFTLEGCWYYSKLHREREVHTQGLLVPGYTTEGEKGSHSRTVSTTVNYRGRERFTLEGCEYHSTLQREKQVHIVL